MHEPARIQLVIRQAQCPPFPEDGCVLVWGNAGSSLITGWICPDSVDDTYTEVWGATNDSPPYIKVVYD